MPCIVYYDMVHCLLWYSFTWFGKAWYGMVYGAVVCYDIMWNCTLCYVIEGYRRYTMV